MGLLKLILAALIGVFSVFTYCSTTADNPVTGETQRVGVTHHQEVQLGRRALPTLVAQYGGLEPSERAQELVDAVGEEVVEDVRDDLPYEYEFHLLDDPVTVNAFALPGGQVCITEALFERLETEGQLAAVLAHEVAHVVARHSAEQIAKQKLTQGLTGAAILASYDPSNPSSADQARMAVLVGELVNMKFGRQDELEADTLGVKLMVEAGYDPNAMVDVMRILQQASNRGARPEFLSTHPSPDNRVGRIQQAIRDLYPEGLPEGLES